MTVSGSNGEGVFPPTIADAVKIAVENTFSAICGEKPTHQANGQQVCNGPCVAGIISFIGGMPRMSLTLVLTQDTAPALAHKFTGMEIPFDTPEMGDAVGELVNVLAGEVVAQLDSRLVKAQMSLPTVVRGNPLELMSESRVAVNRLDFTTKQGRFWLRLAFAIPRQELGRLPGA
jgi:CheY-specific phosphatase CheX